MKKQIKRLWARVGRSPGSKNQTYKNHAYGVARLAEKYASKFGQGNLAYTQGILHDEGKTTDKFQEKMLTNSKDYVDHKTQGARTFVSLAKTPEEKVYYSIMANPMLGHHTSMPNYTEPIGDEKTSYLQYMDPSLHIVEKCISNTYPLKPIEIPKFTGERHECYYSLFMLTKFMHSCLVDADCTDAGRASGEHTDLYRYSTLKTMLKKIKKEISRIKRLPLATDGDRKLIKTIKKFRDIVDKDCYNMAVNKPGFYSLTVPTGLGKTLASVLFALRHATINKMDRIIYAIPFNTIVDQTSNIFKGIFGDNNVIEHHCNFEFKDKKGNVNNKLKYRTEDWDASLIVTTNVQLYETAYASVPSCIRKLHNVNKSVIILDEAQAIPLTHVKPYVEFLRVLVEQYGCTVLFCTATQPKLKETKHFDDIVCKEIIGDVATMFNKVDRTIITDIGIQTITGMADKLNSHHQVLCVVNTKRCAKEIYDNLKGNKYHFSTNMDREDRVVQIKQMQEDLSAGRECRVVSTTLIEAGIDVDFPVVYKYLSGLPSIAQAAGRCNRHYKMAKGLVYTFIIKNYLNGDVIYDAADVKNEVDRTWETIRLFGKIGVTPEIISKYTELIHKFRKTLDHKDIVKTISETLRWNFRNISHDSKYINNDDIKVIIPSTKNSWLIYKLETDNMTKEDFRELQHYIVGIKYSKNNNALDKISYRYPVGYDKEDKIVILTNPEQYTKETGLQIYE